MEFRLQPIIDTMLELYQLPLNSDRFKEYLKILQGDTQGDLDLPIGNFNPMVKEHVIDKLLELKALNAENIMVATLNELNKKFSQNKMGAVFKVVLNLSDDLKGGWTNRYTTDYDTKFGSNALIKRNFCAPIFWTSESFDVDIVRQRTLEFAYRTIYRIQFPKPTTLKSHIEQEKFIAQNLNLKSDLANFEFEKINKFYSEHTDSDNYSLIFNFMYGDEISESLAFPTYGVKTKMAGFEFSKSESN